jgi:putative endonuclease
MTNRAMRLGQSGERLAADYLRKEGYEVVERNVRRPEGEIDLVALDKETLVFVEVKLRRPGGTGKATEALSEAKKRRMAELAVAYSAEHPDLPQSLRVDLIAIDLKVDGSVGSVQHVRSAVER